MLLDPCEGGDCVEGCDAIYAVVADVVTIGYQALCPLLGQQRCEGFDGFVSVGTPSLPTGEYIAGWLIQLDPYNPANSRAGGMGIIPRYQYTVGLKLLEAGYPQIDSEGYLPHPTETNDAAYSSMQHYEAVSRALMRSVETRQLGQRSGCMVMGFGRSQPVPPSAGMVGWTWTVSVVADL